MDTPAERLQYIRERLSAAFAAGKRLNLNYFYSLQNDKGTFQPLHAFPSIIARDVNNCGAAACMVGHLALDHDYLTTAGLEKPVTDTRSLSMPRFARDTLRWVDYFNAQREALEVLVYADSPHRYLSALTGDIGAVTVGHHDPAGSEEDYELPYIDESRCLRLLDIIIAEPFNKEAYLQELRDAKQEAESCSTSTT